MDLDNIIIFSLSRNENYGYDTEEEYVSDYDTLLDSYEEEPEEQDITEEQTEWY